MVEFGNLSLLRTILSGLSMSLFLATTHKLFFPLSLSATSGLFLSTHIFLFNLSNSLFLLNLNSKGMWVLFDLFVGFFGFNLIVCGFCLICLCILFHGIFNDMFWVCFYFHLWVCNANYVF